MARRLLSLFILLSLVCQCFGTVIASWACEGKTCSTSIASCCCVGSILGRDLTCGSALASTKPCLGKCGCKLTLQSSGVTLSASAHQKAQLSPLVELAAVLPSSFELPAAPILSYAPVLPNPPPVSDRPPLLEGAPLRAPPVPFV